MNRDQLIKDAIDEDASGLAVMLATNNIKEAVDFVRNITSGPRGYANNWYTGLVVSAAVRGYLDAGPTGPQMPSIVDPDNMLDGMARVTRVVAFERALIEALTS